MKYIWQKTAWTNLTWKIDKIVHALSRARQAQGYILGQANFFELKDFGEILVEEAFSTSEIEGENLDRNAIRSSIAKRLGLPTAGLPKIQRNCDGLVEMLVDATKNYKITLTKKRLCGWQASLFPTGFSGINKITTGSWRKGKEAMRVVSGPMGREKTHYEAPPSGKLNEEMKMFLDWWNNPPKGLDGIIRASIAHFWFVGIHPFDDGNGRVARAITDMALAQDEKSDKRFYSLSAQIVKEKKKYYDILEKIQKGNGDITKWIVWFLEMFTRSIESSNSLVEKSIFISNFYKYYSKTKLNQRQLKVISKLLECLPNDFEGGLTNKKYVAMTKTSSETAKRDIKELVEKGILLFNEGRGRSTSYRLNRKI